MSEVTELTLTIIGLSIIILLLLSLFSFLLWNIIEELNWKQTSKKVLEKIKQDDELID